MKANRGQLTVWTLITTAFLILAGSTTWAGRITGDTSDAMAVSNSEGNTSVINGTKTPCRVGRFNYGSGKPLNTALVFVFQLPSIGERTFQNATLTFHVMAIQHEGEKTDYNAALYGLDARAVSSVQGGDFYFGQKTDRSARVTKLQDHILTASSGKGPVTSVDLSDWLNDQYADGANAGKYIFLRLNGTGPAGFIADVKNGFLLSTADAEDGQPYISYQASP